MAWVRDFERPSNVDRIILSSIDIPPPEESHGVVACAASPLFVYQIGKDVASNREGRDVNLN